MESGEAATMAVIDLLVETPQLMRASADAAIQAGPDVACERLDAVVHQPVGEFTELLGVSGRSETVEPMVRRVIASALLETGFSAAELQGQLREILATEPDRSGARLADMK